MKAWLKGGLIGAGISAIMTLIHFTLSNINDIFSLFFILNMFIGMPLSGIMTFFGLSMSDPSYDPIAFWIGGILNPLIVSFILGAIIGWIVGKVKSKKQENSSPIK